MDSKTIFPVRLLTLRKSKNMSQKALASELGISDAAITMMEKGKRFPSFDMLIAIAKYFDVPVDYLTGTGIYENWDEIEENWDDLMECIPKFLEEHCDNPTTQLLLLFIQRHRDDKILVTSMLSALLCKIELKDDPETGGRKVTLYFYE